MDQDEKTESIKKFLNPSITDIDQLCHLIDENTFGLKSFPSSGSSSSSKYSSVPFYQIKTFHSSRLKRLHSSSSSSIKSNLNETDNSTYRTYAFPTSLLTRFRSLSTYNLNPQSRRYSTSTISLFRTKSILPSMNEDDSNSSISNESQLSCTIVDTRPSTNHSCNVEELAAYLDDFLYLPKSLSGAAELMYT